MNRREEISPSILKSLLKSFNLGKIEKIAPLKTSGNIAYIIETSQKKFFLRLSPFGIRWRSKWEIKAELDLINYLLDNNFPTPKPIFSRKGEQIISWKNHFGYLREFIEAQPKLTPNLKEINEFGKLLGNFHNLILSYKTKHKRKHIWDLEQTKKNFEEDKKIILKGNFQKKQEFTKNFKKELFALKLPKNLPSGLIHEDLGKRHVLWGKDKIVGIIDFDRSYHGKLILDLAQACRGWCFSNNWEIWSNRKFQALINGYQKERKLTDLEKKSFVDAIKFGILERSISFALRFVEITNDSKDIEFAIYSISNSGLLGMIEKNKEKIEDSL